MRSDLPEKQAAMRERLEARKQRVKERAVLKALRKAPRKIKRKAAPKKVKRKAAPKKRAPKKPFEAPRGYKLVKVPKKRPDCGPISPSGPFNPRRLKLHNDMLERASLIYRQMFPDEWNELKCNMTPMDVMLLAMQKQLHRKNGLMLAAKVAKELMPYLHPRLTHIHATTSKGQLDDLTDEQIAWMLASADRNMKEQEDDAQTISGRVIEDAGDAGGGTYPSSAGEVALFTVS